MNLSCVADSADERAQIEFTAHGGAISRYAGKIAIRDTTEDGSSRKDLARGDA